MSCRDPNCPACRLRALYKELFVDSGVHVAEALTWSNLILAEAYNVDIETSVDDKTKVLH